MSRSFPALALVIFGLVASTGPSLGARQRVRATTPAASVSLFEVHERSILELQTAQTEGRVTSRGLVQSYLARIAAYDQAGPALNTIVLLNPRALDEADALDRERAASGPRGPLHGIPILVKDNYDTVGMPTSGGALGLALLPPSADAFQVQKLRAAGAVVLGKTTMHELAAGITTISSLTGQTRNPYDLMRVPGGSSGGTGAGVAASFAAAGMGSDTCGSIRIPAANQNLVGLRVTRGLSSRTGVMPLSDTQDVAGPLARSVTDLAIVLDATVGPDPADPVTADAQAHVPASYRDGFAGASLKGLRIGVLTALFGAAPEDDEVGIVVRAALDAMKAQGAEVVDATVPGLDELLAESSVIGDEFKFDLAAYLAKHPGAPVSSLGEILDRGLNHAALEQTFRLRNQPATRESEHYRLALVKRRALREAVVSTLEGHKLDVLVYPTLRRKPALIGEAQIGTTCQLSATTGLPALSMPAGFTVDGLPVGIELLGPAFSEAALLARAYAWEQAAAPRRAPFSTPPLVNGQAPPPWTSVVAFGQTSTASTASARLTYHPTTGQLEFDTTVAATEQPLALTLHRMDGDRVGPIVAHLAMRGQRAARGTVTLRGRDREDLVAGRLGARLFTERQPLGSPVVRVTAK
ncbi:MAG: amidase [Acidobacteria bacterium]|nr:amidase [Acidobacteriota bacterium]